MGLAALDCVILRRVALGESEDFRVWMSERVSRPDEPKPVLLGHYAIAAKIADGGMATLYLGCGQGKDASAHRKDDVVALKVIKEGLSGDEVYETMFLDEAKILSKLSHPNVIRTYEYGITPGGHGFIAMELLLGRTLADAWDDHAAKSELMPLGLGTWICARVAAGLHSAHALRDEEGALLQVIHRDVNPSNVFLTYDGEVKLIDFGLARARKRSAKTGDGIVKGKIPYLAPEQATSAPIDRRVDVFALGATLWEVCTGRRLFKRDTDADTLQAVRDANIPDVRTLRPDVPEALAKIVHRALAIDPDARFGTAAEMHRELDTFLEGFEGKVDREAELKAYLDQRFPGERERQLGWVKKASAPRRPMQTIAPPVPIGLDTSDVAGSGPRNPLPEAAITGQYPASTDAARSAVADLDYPQSPKLPKIAVAVGVVVAVGVALALALR